MTEKRKPGRPRILQEGGKRLTVTLDPQAMARALELGAGNPSAGIRKALQVSAELDPKADEAANATRAGASESPVV